jgi:uncharacterized iron-regulated protein
VPTIIGANCRTCFARPSELLIYGPMHRVLLLLLTLTVAPLSSAAGEPIAWKTTLSAAHPLVGKIWRAENATFIGAETLIAHLAGAGFIFLGEKHDNPDHHRLQAWILEGLVAAGKRPAVVWEMFGDDKQIAIDAHIAKNPRDSDGLGDAVDWDSTGWPAWREYQPIADVALANSLPIVAGSLPRDAVQSVGRSGLTALPKARRTRLGLDQPLSKSMSDAMLDVVTKAHCNLMPRSALGPMVAVQRARDAVLADNLVQAKARHGSAVLIAGSGHARLDFAVPVTVASLEPQARIVTMALVEVEDGETDPAGYASNFVAAAFPFDFVWFTPRANNRDYCASLRERFKGHKKTR